MLGSQTMSEGSWRLEGLWLVTGEGSEMSCTVPHQLSAWHAVDTSQIPHALLLCSCHSQLWVGVAALAVLVPPSASSLLVVSEHVSHSVGLVFSCNYKMMLASSIKLKTCCILYLPYQRTFLGNLAVWWCSWNLINILLQNISNGAICVAVGWSLLPEASVMWMQRATFWGGLNGIIFQVTNKHFNWCL